MSKIRFSLASLFILSIAYSLRLTVCYAESDISVVEKPFMEGRYDRAEYEAQKLIDERARARHELYYIKGLSELKLNKFSAARQSFEAIISKSANSNRVFDAYVGIGDSYLLEGNTESAVKAYNETKGKFPSDKNVALLDSRLNDCRKKIGVVPDSPQPAKIMPEGTPQSESKGYTSVQVGCFKSRRNADKLSSKLTASGYESYVELPLATGDRLYRVKVGRLKSKTEADNIAAKLNSSGYKTKICDEISCQ